ncbi:oligoribonuclease [Candidatus Tachikawaea gelatinosa]|uniref:Oligoribonuclease n=1 Tax=Candidatus Tachikawaea gelatinosa TaxID=1410383 RepID=A0A090AL23_9ENTR|nr:oligoribonuclease [Candidatus Tachikawaea gelatinosa]BAP58294.1 oligoribonuclease [Candidatus Tachikawaea gelatinosa]
MNKKNEKNLIWIDLEMTGLNPEKDRIIEIVTLITDSDLNILAEGPTLAIHQTDEVLENMDQWNKKTHSHTGLIEKVKSSNYNEKLAQDLTINFIKKWVPEKKSPICGSTIAQDRRFLFKYMPHLESYFHYRYIDVSTIRELAVRWKPEILISIKKKSKHQALFDIRESVAELNYYRKFFFTKK